MRAATPIWGWSGTARDPDWEVLSAVTWIEETTVQLGIPGFGLLGFLRGYADGVDRFPHTPPDFLVDRCLADERVVAAFAAAQAAAQDDALVWDELSLAERGALVLETVESVPATPDMHLTGDCYGRIAELAYPHLQAAEVLP